MTGNRPACSRARVVNQGVSVLLAVELRQRRCEHMFAKPRIVAAADRSLDVGGAHVERELGPVVHERRPFTRLARRSLSEATLSAGGLMMRSIWAANASKASCFSRKY